MERHRQVVPVSQYSDVAMIGAFGMRDRIRTLQPKLVLIQGVDDPGQPPAYEREIHEAIPDSRHVKLENAGYFPMAERPGDVNRIIEELVGSVS